MKWRDIREFLHKIRIHLLHLYSTVIQGVSGRVDPLLLPHPTPYWAPSRTYLGRRTAEWARKLHRSNRRPCGERFHVYLSCEPCIHLRRLYPQRTIPCLKESRRHRLPRRKNTPWPRCVSLALAITFTRGYLLATFVPRG